jgi:hypothetical protein
VSLKFILYRTLSEAFTEAVRNEVLAGDVLCQYGVCVQRFGDYLRYHPQWLKTAREKLIYFYQFLS